MKGFSSYVGLVFGIILLGLLAGLGWAGDFNNDGMEDLVWHHDSNGVVAPGS